MGGKRPRDIEKYFQDKYKKTERIIKDDDQFKTLDEVFDHQNLRYIYDLFKRNLISTVDRPISTGKEANVFVCTTTKGEEIVLKIFRTSTATFKSYLPYLDGDPRFDNIKRDRRGIIYAWAFKEFKNLMRLEKAKVRVPKPIFNHKNMLLMGFIKLDEDPAPPLKNASMEPADVKVVGKEVLKFTKLMYQKARLVHSDLSEYNILISNDGPVVIDVGQAVVLDHPHSEEYLERDVLNLCRYFNNEADMGWDEEKTLKEIKGE
jgi:RIO kinase 1